MRSGIAAFPIIRRDRYVLLNMWKILAIYIIVIIHGYIKIVTL